MKKILALMLVVIMAVALVACNKPTTPTTDPTEKPADVTEKPADVTEKPADETQAPEITPEPVVPDEKTLVVGYSPFSSKFSPFFAQTAYDQDAQGMTQVGLLTSDRTGAIITKGIEGETINYNGTDYTYYGPADLEITENADGTVYYDFTLREDITFSDGEPMTIDDVIFSMYVLADPTYDGSSTFFAQPIEGMEAYRAGYVTLAAYIYGLGEETEDFSLVSQEEQAEFWTKYHAASLALAEEITDYCVAHYADHGATGPQTSAALWGFEIEEDTNESFAAALEAAYKEDVAGMIDTENAGSSVEDLFPGFDHYTQTPVQVGDSANTITGIQKIDDYHLRVVLTEVDATAIYQLGVTIAPMHYYGEKEKYDYANNKFGFDKGNLEHVRSVTTQPMGAGPYKFIKYDKGVINYECNESYFLGCPRTRYINFQETLNDNDKLNGLLTGTIDIGDPSFSNDTIKAIKEANGGDITGPVITTNTVDNLGYGYIGINSIRVSVGDEPGSDASKNLRRAFATVFSVYRNVAIDSYYGDRASVINYPISNTSWAAPRPSDDGYEIAFSKDVNGNDIYTSSMTDDEKYAAAMTAALGFLEAAGYTVADGVVTAAPEGGKMSYEFWIPGDGTGDHPSFMIVNRSMEAFKEVGIEIVIKDLANSSDLWNNLDANQVDMWAAAWGASVDPDMYQIYYSDAANGPIGSTSKKNANGGPAQGGSNYMYCITSEELDELIKEGRSSTDQEFRKAIYKSCLDIIIDWADEVPVYQRQNAVLFSTERVNLSTVTPDITTFYGWMAEIQNLRMN